MRRKEKEITDDGIAIEILSNSKIVRLAMIDNDKPYIVPLNYGYHENSIYMHSAPEGRKIEILKKSNYVCFEIEYFVDIIVNDRSCKWSTKYRSIIGYGKVEIINNFEQKKKGLDFIMSHNGKKSGNAYEDDLVNKMVILKLKIENISVKQSGNWN